MGQGVIWYTGQFYAQSFLENTVKIEFMQNREILLWGIGLATPFFLVFGALSDRIGRKWIMLTGMLLGVLFYRPIFNTFLKDANPAAWMNDGANISREPGGAKFTRDTIKVNDHMQFVNKRETIFSYNGNRFTERSTDTTDLPGNTLGDAQIVGAARKGKPVYSDVVLSSALQWKFTFLVWCMIIFVTMAYAPIAAFLVELFPTRIRYTSMSLPYHIGNGVFGGLVPFIATLLSTSFANDPLVGLWYPIAVAALCFVIGAVYLSNKIDQNIND